MYRPLPSVLFGAPPNGICPGKSSNPRLEIQRMYWNGTILLCDCKYSIPSIVRHTPAHLFLLLYSLRPVFIL